MEREAFGQVLQRGDKGETDQDRADREQTDEHDEHPFQEAVPVGPGQCDEDTMMTIDHAKGVKTWTIVWKMIPTIATSPPMCTAPR